MGGQLSQWGGLGCQGHRGIYDGLYSQAPLLGVSCLLQQRDPGAEGWQAQDGWEGRLGQYSRGWVPAAGWAAKQGAVGEEGRWGVPAEGGGSKGGGHSGSRL